LDKTYRGYDINEGGLMMGLRKKAFPHSGNQQPGKDDQMTG
jgi:hypothetical protein